MRGPARSVTTARKAVRAGVEGLSRVTRIRRRPSLRQRRPGWRASGLSRTMSARAAARRPRSRVPDPVGRRRRWSGVVCRVHSRWSRRAPTRRPPLALSGKSRMSLGSTGRPDHEDESSSGGGWPGCWGGCWAPLHAGLDPSVQPPLLARVAERQGEPRPMIVIGASGTVAGLRAWLAAAGTSNASSLSAAWSRSDAGMADGHRHRVTEVSPAWLR